MFTWSPRLFELSQKCFKVFARVYLPRKLLNPSFHLFSRWRQKGKNFEKLYTTAERTVCISIYHPWTSGGALILLDKEEGWRRSANCNIPYPIISFYDTNKNSCTALPVLPCTQQKSASFILYFSGQNYYHCCNLLAHLLTYKRVVLPVPLTGSVADPDDCWPDTDPTFENVRIRILTQINFRPTFVWKFFW
jgi:hypothetical protein